MPGAKDAYVTPVDARAEKNRKLTGQAGVRVEAAVIKVTLRERSHENKDKVTDFDRKQGCILTRFINVALALCNAEIAALLAFCGRLAE